MNIKNKLNHLVLVVSTVDPCNPELKGPSLLSISIPTPKKGKQSKSLTICVNKELFSFKNMTFE